MLVFQQTRKSTELSGKKKNQNSKRSGFVFLFRCPVKVSSHDSSQASALFVVVVGQDLRPAIFCGFTPAASGNDVN